MAGSLTSAGGIECTEVVGHEPRSLLNYELLTKQGTFSPDLNIRPVSAVVGQASLYLAQVHTRRREHKSLTKARRRRRERTNYENSSLIIAHWPDRLFAVARECGALENCLFPVTIVAIISARRSRYIMASNIAMNMARSSSLIDLPCRHTFVRDHIHGSDKQSVCFPYASNLYSAGGTNRTP